MNQVGSGTEPPPPNMIELWNEVSDGLDRNATVVWGKAVKSLESARRHLQPPHVSPEARSFVDTKMCTIISILLEQQPNKIGPSERDCVEKSIWVALKIVRDDLETIVSNDMKVWEKQHQLEPCPSLAVLHQIFNKEKLYYKGAKNKSSPKPHGLPEVRIRAIMIFKQLRGFHFLGRYLEKRTSMNKGQQQQQQPFQFPKLETLQIILESLRELIPLPLPTSPDDWSQADIFRITDATKRYLLSLDEDALNSLKLDAIKVTIHHLQLVFDRLARSHPHYASKYYDFARQFVLKLITSASIPHKLMGWTILEEIIQASVDKHPPPKSFVVSGAGLDFINGSYTIDPEKITEGGYVKPNTDISYVRKIPDDPAEDGAGKTLTLHRCTMRSQQKWWFISEADEKQPGTDKDIDYYQHKSGPCDGSRPSAEGWVTCRCGLDPPPTLRGVGSIVPEGEEENTLKCALAKWAIENEVIELVFGDGIHSEIVAKSTALIKFLAGMCEAESGDRGSDSAVEAPMQVVSTPKPYCLKLSHLLMTWEAYTSKTDAVVSGTIRSVLVATLPSMHDDLAISFLQAMQSDVNQGKHNFSKASEFCYGIVNELDLYNEKNNRVYIRMRVRQEILRLLWAIITHEDFQTLNYSYEKVKKYVAHEIRQVEASAEEIRHQFLQYCREVLTKHSTMGSLDVVNETHALHMVQMTRFVLESFRRDECLLAIGATVTAENNGEDENKSLSDLLLSELTAYLNRASTIRKPPSASGAALGFNYSKALSDRLQILKYIYGISSASEMTSQQVDHLLSLCTLPVDREAIMTFAGGLNRKVAGSNCSALPLDDGPSQTAAPSNKSLTRSTKERDLKKKKSEAINAAISSAIKSPTNEIDPGCLRRATALGISEDKLKIKCKQSIATRAVVDSALGHWYGEINQESWKHALELGVSEKLLKERVQAAIKKRDDKNRRKDEERKKKYEQQKKEELAKVKENLALFDSSCTIELKRAIETLNIFEKYFYDLDVDMSRFKTAHWPALIKTLVGTKLESWNKDNVKTHLGSFIQSYNSVSGGVSASDKHQDNNPQSYEDAYFSTCAQILHKYPPVFQNKTAQGIWRSLAVDFVVGSDGFRKFDNYLQAYDAAKKFPSLGLILTFLNAVIFVMSTRKATHHETTMGYLKSASNIWSVVKQHMDKDPSSFNQHHSDLKKICEAFLLINPYLKECSDYVQGQSAPAPVTPSNKSRNAADFFSAEESAKARLKSLERVKVRVAKLVDHLVECYNESDTKLNELDAAMTTTREAYLIAKNGIESASDELAKAEKLGVSAVIDYARERLAAAKELESSTRKPMEDSFKAYNEAVEIHKKAKKAMEDAKSEQSVLMKELEEARAYLNELYEKNEVIDVDVESPSGEEPAKKKQRLTTP